jgi:hypothetical protein
VIPPAEEKQAQADAAANTFEAAARMGLGKGWNMALHPVQ